MECVIGERLTDSISYSFRGFLQVYQLQTENDEDETWRDLVSHDLMVMISFSVS
jgi:hypothetical protein